MCMDFLTRWYKGTDHLSPCTIQKILYCHCMGGVSQITQLFDVRIKPGILFIKKLLATSSLLIVCISCSCSNSYEFSTARHTEDIEWIVREEVIEITPPGISVVTHEWTLTTPYPRESSRSWVEELVERQGEENINFHTWSFTPAYASRLAEISNEIANDTNVSVVIFDSSSSMMSDLVDTLSQRRSDIFLALYDLNRTDFHFANRSFGTPQSFIRHFYEQDPIGVAGAGLILEFDMYRMLRNLPQVAQSLGAASLIYFFDSISWDENGNEVDVEENYIHRIIREASEEIGITFAGIDISGVVTCSSTEDEFMRIFLPSLIEMHGSDIVFVGLDHWHTLIKWEANDTIFLPVYSSWFEPTPRDFASFREIPLVFGESIICTEMLIEEIRTILDRSDKRGRIASWPASMHLLFPLAAAEYGVMWANGRVSEDEIDLAVLEEIFARLIFEYSGEELGVTLTQDGNRVLVLPDYLIY